MKVTELRTPPPADGLAGLHKVVLDAARQAQLDRLAASCGGGAVWRRRKLAEARELLALSQIAPRFKVLEIDVREAIRVQAALRVPVLCREPNGEFVTAPVALLGITCRQEALSLPRPGYEFVSILMPRGVWHANVTPDLVQALCLGPEILTGTPLKEMVVQTYGALSMQSVQIDERDSAGIMNLDACRWWQANLGKIPLSHEAFLSPPVEEVRP